MPRPVLDSVTCRQCAGPLKAHQQAFCGWPCRRIATLQRREQLARDLAKACATCKLPLHKTTHGGWHSLPEAWPEFARRKYCSDPCRRKGRVRTWAEKMRARA